MLNNATGFDRIYIACGYTDLRQGIDGLSAVIRRQLGVDPFQKNVLFMFCGRKPDKIKCCKQSSKISQNSPESIPLLAGPEGTIRHKVYQSCVVSL